MDAIKHSMETSNLLSKAMPHLEARLDQLRVFGANSSDYKIGEEYRSLNDLIKKISQHQGLNQDDSRCWCGEGIGAGKCDKCKEGSKDGK